MTHDRPPSAKRSRRAQRQFTWTVASIDRRAQRPRDDAIDGSSSDLSGCGAAPVDHRTAKTGRRR